MKLRHEGIQREIMQEHLGYSEALETMKKFDRCWSGPDIEITETQTIDKKTSQIAFLSVGRENFPPDINLDLNIARLLHLSTRSRFAQTGIEIDFTDQSFSDDIIERINKGEKVNIPVKINNQGTRPVELEGGVARFFWFNEPDRLKGEELKNAISSSIKIGGENGKDWFFIDSDHKADKKIDQSRDAEYSMGSIPCQKNISIVLPIKKKLYIPESNKPLKIKNRKDLEDELKPKPASGNYDSETVEIGETERLTLDNETCAVINWGVSDTGGIHRKSVFIDPGFDGHIRTETLFNGSKTPLGLEYIEVNFYHKK